MKTLTHALAQEWILSGRMLDPEEAAGLSEHLAGCPECRPFAAFQKELQTGIPRIAPAVTHTESELRQKTAAVQARLKQRSTSTRFFHGTRALAMGLATVAIVALLAFVIVRLIPEQNRLSPGGLAKTPIHETAAASATPAPSSTPMASATVIPPEVQSFLKTFPLTSGTQWVYTDTEYDPDPNDPAKTIQAVFEITDTVVEVKNSGTDTYAHLQRKVRKVGSDKAWSEQSHNPPAESEWWYIVHAGQVYSIPNLPADLQGIDFDTLTLEYQFPLAEGGRWCPNRLTKGNLDPAAPTMEPCANNIGARLVQKADAFQSAAGTFPTCYLLEDVYNTGNILQTFCDGVGVVARKFDHPGTRFGFSWVLTGFRPASSGDGNTVTKSPIPVLTTQLTDEQVLAKALLNTDQNAYCSWQILGQDTAIYAWVLCELQAEPHSAASVPVVIHLDSTRHYSQVDVPGDGTRYASDVQRLFPAEIQSLILGQNLNLKGLEWGIAQRKAGKFSTAYIIPNIDFNGFGCNWVHEPVPDVPGAGGTPASGWSKVTLPEPGFTLNVPQGWRVEQARQTCGDTPGEVHFLNLQTPDGFYQLSIGFRRPDQPVWITRSGTPAGDFVDAAAVSFFGNEIPVQKLVYLGHDVAVFYNGAGEFAANGTLFTLSLDIMSEPQNDRSLPADVEDQARQILASFQVYPPSGLGLTPTPAPAQAAAQPLTLVSQRGGAVAGLALEGSTAFVGIGPRLAAVDLSDPAAPRQIAESPAPPGSRF